MTKITTFINKNKLFSSVLFLSSYFKRHQKNYYNKLHGYHYSEVENWIDFFLDGVIDTANESIDISKKITKLHDADMAKIQALAKRESQSSILILRKLYLRPIITTRNIMEWTGFSRPGAQKAIDRFIKLEILNARDEKETYDRTYIYRKYLNIFLG